MGAGEEPGGIAAEAIFKGSPLRASACRLQGRAAGRMTMKRGVCGVRHVKPIGYGWKTLCFLGDGFSAALELDFRICKAVSLSLQVTYGDCTPNGEITAC